MLRISSRIMVKVGMVNLCGQVRCCHLVKPLSVTLVTARYLNYQNGLPKVPVPSLRETCEHYLSALEPIVEENELKRTKQLVEQFLKGGVGEKLQSTLERKAHNTDNWTADYWGKMHYFENRNPVVVYSNIGTVCPRLDFWDKQGQIRCAARIIAAVLEFKEMIDNETLPAETMGGNRLCMAQYLQILSSCRIPGLEVDSVVFHAKSHNPPKHITVLHKSQFFVVEVYNSDGTPLTVDQLCVQLEKICSSSSETNTEPVGILTTLNRDSWSKAYLSLLKDKTNSESLSAIEKSICTVCLDRAIPQESEKCIRSDLAHIMHGGGSQWNSANRWFDKSLQLIVAEDGTCGVNAMHIAADGIVAQAFTDYLVASVKKPEIMQTSMLPLRMPQKLHFNITTDMKKTIEEAKQSMDRIIQSLDLSVMVFDHFGKSYLKANKMSPDTFIQMAIQLAYYRMNKQCCASYEAVSQRMFRHGRVSLLLSTSSASAAFVKAFDDVTKQNTEKRDLMDKAMKAHRANANMVINGHDIVVHLYALSMQAVEMKISMPDIFTDTSYDKFQEYQLITTQVTSKTGCVAINQVDEYTGYSICYCIYNGHIIIEMVTSNIYKKQNADHLNQAVKDALLDMKALLEQTSRATSN